MRKREIDWDVVIMGTMGILITAGISISLILVAISGGPTSGGCVR